VKSTVAASFLLILFLAPLAWMVAVSLGVGTGIESPAEAIARFTWSNYEDILARGGFGRYLLNSSIVVVLVVAANLVFCSMVGYALARYRGRSGKVTLAAVLSTLMIPKQVTMIPIYMLITKTGMFDTYLALTLPFFVDAFNVFLVRQYFLELPLELEEAARLDGASDFSVLWRVVIPIGKPVLAVVGINTFLVNWNSFLYPLILTSSRSMRTLPVGLALYSQGPFGYDWGHLMAGSTLTVLPIAVAFLFFQRWIVKGITAGALG